jgi:hypothetical protein
MYYLYLLVLLSSTAFAQANPYSNDTNMKKAQAEYVQKTYCPDGSQPVNGVCRGYVAAPARPLECGGATASYNMKWIKEGEKPSKECK